MMVRWSGVVQVSVRWMSGERRISIWAWHWWTWNLFIPLVKYLWFQIRFETGNKITKPISSPRMTEVNFWLNSSKGETQSPTPCSRARGVCWKQETWSVIVTCWTMWPCGVTRDMSHIGATLHHTWDHCRHPGGQDQIKIFTDGLFRIIFVSPLVWFWSSFELFELTPYLAPGLN